MSSLKMLAIDLGASSGRGIVGRFDGEKLTLEENHRFSNDPLKLSGHFTWDIMRILFEIKNSIRKCALSDDKDIKSIGIDTWGVDYGLLDKNGKLLYNPTHYRDTRTDGIQEYTFKNIVSKEDIYNTTGLQFMDFNTLFQLIAEKKDDPSIFEKADKMLFTPDLLGYFLTGEKQTEYTIASTSALIDANTRDWAWNLIDKAGIPRSLFTPISKPGTVVGDLNTDTLEDVGAIGAKVVHTTAHDTASAVVAVPADGEQFVYISSGTWSLMGTELKNPKINADTMKYDFTNEGGAENTIRFLKNIMGLWLEQESKRQWAREGEQVTYDQLSDMAMASKPLQCIINPDDALFSGPGDMPGRIAQYCKQTGQHVPENKGEIVRCIFDSLALRYRWTVERINELMGTKIPFINIVGGGTKEAPLCQLAADSCGIPVYAGPVEATAIGNLMTQAIATGEVKDVAQAREVVRNSFEIDHYEPKKSADWDDGYDRFLKLIEK